MLTNLYRAGAFGLAALISALLLTPLARGLMRRLGAIDLPDPRRVNRVPVPRGGGVAVVVTVLAALLVAARWWPTEIFGLATDVVLLPWFVASAVGLVAVGFIDDRFGVPPWLKLLVQLVVAEAMCVGGARLILPSTWGAWVNSPWIYGPLTVAWYVGVVNAFNLIDGLDGLSSGLAIIATAGMTGVVLVMNPSVVPLLPVIFVGALLGFLRYNYNPASVFLGDSGSLFVGFLLATLALVFRRSDTFLATMGLSVLCVGVPLIDTTLAILRRTLRYVLRRGEEKSVAPGETSAVMTADRDHVHHRFLLMAHGNQRVAVWGLYGLAVALVALGFVTLGLRAGNATVFLMGFMVVAVVIVRTMTNVEFWDAGRLLAKQGARNGRRAIAIPLYLMADLLSMVGLFFGVRALLRPMLPALPGVMWLNLLLAYAVPVLICLLVTRAYARIWGRSTRKDALLVFMAVMIGSAVSHLGVIYLLATVARQLCVFHVFWSLLLPIPLLMARLLKTAFLQYLTASENNRLKRASETDASIERILFYGAGVNLRAYITIYEVNVTRNQVALIGVLDDNLGLRGRIFRDLPILGPLEDLEDEARFKHLHPTRIILTTPLINAERQADIERFCREKGIALSRCRMAEEELLPRGNVY